MANQPNLLRRYLFRKDFTSRVAAKLSAYRRRITKDSFNDQVRLLDGQPVSVIFDVGANVGDTLATYGKLYPNAAITGFEPTPQLMPQLQARFKDKPNVGFVGQAVSNTIATVPMYNSKLPVMNSLLEPVSLNRWGFNAENPTIDVNTITLDAYTEQQGIKGIDILKLDIQGSELNALKGAEGLLRASAISLIYTEALVIPFYKGQPLAHDLTAYLAQFDYSLFNIYTIKESPLGQARWFDAIYLSPQMRERLTKAWGVVYCGW